MGNCKVERAKLSPGFVPLGVKEYGGIIYIASYNPDTKEEEIGCFPSPERDITGTSKIEQQTGLVDGKFNVSDYALPTVKLNDQYIPEALISKIQKLNEQEVLKLNPGDKYITTYKLIPVAGDTPITEDNFDTYFSFDPDDRKLFNINFYRIDSDNNIIPVEDTIKSVPYRSAIEESDYVYFTESSGGSLSVEIRLNSIDYFAASVREISKRSETDKKVRIEAIGESVSGMTFEGVRIDITKNKELAGEEIKTYHIGKTDPDERKVSATIKDLASEDTLDCEITPYSKYGYLADLKQSFFLKLGQNISTDVVNEVFRWYINAKNSRLELDFDFKLDTENPFKLFLEFYDPWSNISTIRTVTNPSIYGPMRLTVDLVDEPKNQIFDVYPNANGQYGGVSMSKLIESTSINNKPLMIDEARSNGKLLIRSDNSLRKNHFYLVRICGYEELVEGGVVTNVKSDVYRGLYTNVAYNDIYDEQISMNELNPEYKPNFNNIPYPKEKIKLSASKSGNTQLNIGNPTLTEDPADIPKTVYKGTEELFSLTERPTESRIILNSAYTAKKNYTLSLNRSNDYIYGDLKDGIIEVLTTGSVIPLKPENIVDMNIDFTIPMNSKGTITIPTLTSSTDLFTVELNLETNRPSKGTVAVTPSHLVPRAVSLIDKVYKPDHLGYANYAIGLHRGKHDEKDVNKPIDTTIFAFYQDQTKDLSKDARRLRSQGQELGSNNTLIVGPVNIIDNWWEEIEMNDKNFFSMEYNEYILLTTSSSSASLARSKGIMFFSKAKNQIVSIPVYSEQGTIKQIVKELFSNMFYNVFDNLPSTGYFIDSYLFYDQNSESRFTNMSFDIKTGWVPQTSKKYIFRSYDRQANNIADFTTAKVNDIITKAIAKEPNTVLNGALEDNNFIPYVDENTVYEDVNYNIKLDDETIKRATDTQQVRLLSNSKDAADSRISEINNIDVGAKQPVEYNPPYILPPIMYARYLAFSKLFEYDPQTKSVEFVGSANSTIDMVGTGMKHQKTLFRATQMLTL